MKLRTPDILTTSDAAAMVGVCHRTIASWIEKGVVDVTARAAVKFEVRFA